jgi:hypothetical protein
MFIGLDVHKATISVAVAQGERGGELCHWGKFHTARTPSGSWWRNWALMGVTCISAMKPDHVAMACTASLLSWDMTASWLPLPSSL